MYVTHYQYEDLVRSMMKTPFQTAEMIGRFFLVANENMAPSNGRLPRADFPSRPSTANGDKRGDLDSLSGMAFGR